MNTKISVSTLASMACVAALTLGASGVAQAQEDIFWSVGMSSPGVRIGVSNAPAVVVQHPVYVQQAHVYVAPRPVVYMAPQPVYYGYGYGNRSYREHEGYRSYGYRGGERGEYRRGGERFDHERGGRSEGRGEGRFEGRGEARGTGEVVRSR
jgi:hypothetical protein